jgi:hypothetical protein
MSVKNQISYQAKIQAWDQVDNQVEYKVSIRVTVKSIYRMFGIQIQVNDQVREDLA